MPPLSPLERRWQDAHAAAAAAARAIAASFDAYSTFQLPASARFCFPAVDGSSDSSSSIFTSDAITESERSGFATSARSVSAVLMLSVAAAIILIPAGEPRVLAAAASSGTHAGCVGPRGIARIFGFFRAVAEKKQHVHTHMKVHAKLSEIHFPKTSLCGRARGAMCDDP